MAKKIAKLTLAQILPHIDLLHRIKLIDATGPDEEIIFEGSVMDVPWFWLDMVLDTTAEGEAISCDTIVNEYGVTIGRFIITVKENEE